MTTPSRNTNDKLALFRACFTGLPNIYGTYDPATSQVWQVKEPVTDPVLLNHLQGRQPYGVYLLMHDRTRAIAADFDEESLLNPLQFLNQAGHYGLHAYLERSKKKGWHAWIFLGGQGEGRGKECGGGRGVLAAKARAVVKAILEDIEAPATEVFPKQDVLGGGVPYGNFINAPLFGGLVPQGRSVFVDPDADFRPYPNQWDLLAQVQRVPESLLNDIIEINDLMPTAPAAVPTKPVLGVGQGEQGGNKGARGGWVGRSGLLPCGARMLAEGVKSFQRLSCFRLAIQLKRLGLPLPAAVAVLLDWSTRNRPSDGKRQITPDEVQAQVRWAYLRNYRGCGCEEPAVAAYCDPSCPLHPSARHKTPVAATTPTPPSPPDPPAPKEKFMENRPLRLHRLQLNLRWELLQRQYLLKDAQGQVIEAPHQMLSRVASAVAAVEAVHGATPGQIRSLGQQFYGLMRQRMFLPNSPALMNAGRHDGMCCACFVLDIEDSVDGIFDAVKQTALIQKAGGGTGFSFDKLRPTGDLVASTGGRTSGPISFWRVIAETTHAIQQGAHRRGANMAMISIDHPDILKFILAKRQPGTFENFNVSIKVTGTFMELLTQDPDGYHLVTNPRNQKRYVLPRSVDLARYAIDDLLAPEAAVVPCYTRGQIWDLIVAGAHASGEPGVCFIDRVNQDNPTPALGRIEATNPCGEQPLLPFEACNLGSLNLARFVKGTDLDWDQLRQAIMLAVRFLDNVVDLTHYPTEQIHARSLGNRKIGLGIMGFADALVLLGLRYDSEAAIGWATKVSEFIQAEAHRASQKLAEERGTFPNWAGSIWESRQRPMRNASVTTIAPTGSISILANCSSGIEPLFHLAYCRRAMGGQEFIQVHPLLETLGRRDGWLTEPVRQALLDGLPSQEIPGIPPRLAQMLVTAHQVAPEWHVRMQAAFQAHIDNAVSKTVNLPATATVSDVDRVFRLAYAQRCKGITVYVDGSRSGQTIAAANATPHVSVVRPRGRVTTGQTFKFRMACGTLFVTVNRDDQGLCEVFSNLGKAGGCSAQSEATCRAASVALRSGVDPQQIIEQLRGIRCLATARAKGNGHADVLSCPDAIAKALAEALGTAKGVEPAIRKCPDCGATLGRQAGCWVCTCGFSRCG